MKNKLTQKYIKQLAKRKPCNNDTCDICELFKLAQMYMALKASIATKNKNNAYEGGR